MQQPSRSRLFLGIFLLMAVLKIFLVADQEIFGQRFDDMGYAMSIMDHYYNCDPNLNWLFIRPLGFPLFGALCMETGIPYRICIEVFFLICSWFFCTGVKQIIRSDLVVSVCAFALLFHPWVLVGFNQLLTEPYYFCLMLLLAGVSVRLLARPVWRLRTGGLWAMGLLIAVMMLTRREEPWVFGLLALVFLIRFLFLRFRFHLPWRRSFLQMLLILVPLVTYQGVILTVSAMNYAKWGIFATNEQEAPGFSGLLDTLYRIDTPDPSLWAPVTAETLRMAMEASPRFAELEEGLFDTNNPHLEYGERTTGRKGELGAWMWWRLYDSLAAAGIYTSPKAANAWMLAATAELEAALEDGTLPERSFSTKFPIDPNIGIWLPEFPRLFLNTLKRLHFRKDEPDFTAKEAQIPSMYTYYFDKAANRRISLLAGNSVEVAGHAFSSAGRLDFIAVENSAGETVAATAPQGFVYWKLRDIEQLTGEEGIFETAFRVHFIPRDPGPFTLSLWKDGQRLHAHELRNRPYPHRLRSEGAPDRAAIDLTIIRYLNPLPDTAETMRALLRGWAFTSLGPVTHVSLVNAREQFLKLEAFRLERPDLSGMYKEQLGDEPESPLGFHIETPVLDLSPITVQFWRDSILIHEMALEDLPEGYWERIEETRSGIPLVLGIGRQHLPEYVETGMTLREAVRAHFIAHYYLYVLAGAIVVALLVALANRWHFPEPVVDCWQAAALLGFLALFLFGRALFYGLVEAAVVPGVERYMDCAAPFLGVLIVLAMAAPLLGLNDRWLARKGKAATLEPGGSG